MSETSNKRNTRAGLRKHDTSATLRNPKLVFKTFMECLEEGDGEAAREVLAASLWQLNKSRLERRYGIPRRTIYNLLTRKTAPSLDLVAKVCHAIREEVSRA
ncbi:MAG: hypothetical protein HY925_00940 [Elusimicrobia bacterium]|nr:hypothetical protein [Elusimicrobiota bacterium]